MIGAIIGGALKGVSQILADGRLRRIFWKTLALCILAYLVAGGIAYFVIDYLATFDVSWLPDWAVRWVRGLFEASAVLGVLWLMWMIFPAVATALVSIFVDEVPAIVEARYYPHDRPGNEPNLLSSLRRSLLLGLLLVVINVLLLPFYVASIWLPPLYIVLYYAVNGYFIGREYFEVAAIRHLDDAGVYTARRRNGTTVFLAGALVAFGLTIPILNLVIPVAGAAMMVHVYKELGRRGRIGEASRGMAAPPRGGI